MLCYILFAIALLLTLANIYIVIRRNVKRRKTKNRTILSCYCNGRIERVIVQSDSSLIARGRTIIIIKEDRRQKAKNQSDKLKKDHNYDTVVKVLIKALNHKRQRIIDSVLEFVQFIHEKGEREHDNQKE